MRLLTGIPVLNQNFRFEVREESQVGEARRRTSEISSFCGFSGTEAGSVAIVVTEIARNILKHGGGGEVLVCAARDRDDFRLDIIGLDRGPGFSDMGRCMEDGYSTAGSPGTGLGAIKRLSTVFDIFSAPGAGTAILSRYSRKKNRGGKTTMPMEIGAINVAMDGEELSGDCWAAVESSGRTLLLVADGLGHGLLATDASRAAEKVFQERCLLGPKELLEHIHRGLLSTRGAAVAIAEVIHGRDTVKYAGIGNISGLIHASPKGRSMVSMNGIAGGDPRRIQEFSYPLSLPENSGQSLIIMYSDGIATVSGLDRYPGLVNRHPTLIAAVIFRDFQRGRDDAVVLVAKQREQEM